MLDKIADLRKDFERFRDDCAWCRQVYLIHTALFHGNKQTDTLLRDVAGWFFYDLSAITQEYNIVVVGRLTDPAGQPGRPNLSAPYLAARLSELGLCSLEIDIALDEVLSYREKITHSRHKLVAHRDRNTIANRSFGASHAMEDVNRFHSSLNRFCDLVAIAIGLQPVDLSALPAKGDVSEFIAFMRRARPHHDR